MRDDKRKSRSIIYVSILAIILIGISIVSIVLSNDKNEPIELKQTELADLNEIYEENTTEASSQTGKTVNEVKLAKFEMVVRETCKWLLSPYETGDISSFVLLPFYLPILDNSKIDKYLENAYLEKIYSVCFDEEKSKLGPEVQYLRSTIEELKDYVLFCKLDRYRDPAPCAGSQIRGGLIFWALILVAIDEEFYKNEVNMIADLAYMLDFNEDMMADWIQAVKYLLGGNMFNENMNIDFKTAEAKLFFKHEGLD